METEQVDPRILQLKFLKTIGEEVKALKTTTENSVKVMQSMVEEGVVEPLRPITVTQSGIIVHPPRWGEGKLWFGIKLTNDGDNSVYVIVNTGKSPPTPQELKPDETWGVQFKTAVIEDVRLYTESGTSTVRVRGER